MAQVLTFPTAVRDEKDFGGSHWSRKAPPQAVIVFFSPSLSHYVGG